MLNEYRNRLDQIDNAIVDAFSARLDTIGEIGAYKREHHIDAYDPERERAMLERLCLRVPEQQRQSVCTLYEAILAISKAQQRFENTNLVLIGMPGAGKTAIARHLAEILDRPISSTDEEAERRIGDTIESLFRTKGEAAFRRIETEAVRSLTSVWGSIIATGGGTILSPENRAILRENSRIYYVKRPLGELDMTGRPLSQGPGALERLYAERHALYETFADVQLDADEDFQETARRIAEEFQKAFHP